MAKWIIWTEEQKVAYAAWLAERPDFIRNMVTEHNLSPDKLYRLKSSGSRVTLYSLDENGTVTVNVLREFNPETMILDIQERSVFGIKPTDLEECDLPEGLEPQT